MVQNTQDCFSKDHLNKIGKSFTTQEKISLKYFLRQIEIKENEINFTANY